jgi:hypothetical protein
VPTLNDRSAANERETTANDRVLRFMAQPLYSMIRKVGTGFSKRSCSTKKLERQSIQFEAITLWVEV